MRSTSLTVLVCFVMAFSCAAQTKSLKSSKFFFSTGYGLGGNFFVRDYYESLPFPNSGYTSFLKKNFLGTVQEVSGGIHLNKSTDLIFGYSRQRFTRKVFVDDTLPRNVGISMDLRIHHVDNMWFGGVVKNYTQRKSTLSWGGGIYWIRAQQQELEIYPGYVILRERKMEDGGAFAQIGYEYKYQPKVHLGIKGQFFWILSGSYAESVTLVPYIKIDF